MNSKICIALDFETKEEVYQFLDRFGEEKLFVKVGMELFYGQGIEMIEEIKKRGHDVFLDLKLHDIPNTVKRAMKQLAKLNVDMVNVHASGSIAMMKAALEGFNEAKVEKRPLITAVTVLTSLDQETINRELSVKMTPAEFALKLAANAKAAGLDGVVCSPLESPLIHDKLGADFITITPGIRLASDSKDDQKRVTSPTKARELGSTYIVVGRTITQAADPLKTYKLVKKEFDGE